MAAGGFAGNAFENDGAGAGASERKGVGLELQNRIDTARLHAIAAHAMHALRRKAEMADDRNFGFNEGPHQLDTRAFDLDGFSACLLEKTDGVGDAVADRTVIAAEGHVGHHEGTAYTAAHGTRVVQHLVHGHGQRVFVAEHDHGERVPDKNEIDAGLVDETRRRVIVGSESRDGLALALHLGQCGHSDFGKRMAALRERCASGKIGEAHVWLQCRSANSGCDPNITSIRCAGRGMGIKNARDSGRVGPRAMRPDHLHS